MRSSIRSDFKIKKNYGDYATLTFHYEHYVADVRIYAELRVAMSSIFVIMGHSVIALTA
jgi:hypothetical protein